MRRSSRGTSRKQLELQLTSMWPGVHRSSQLLPGDIHRRTMLNCAVYSCQGCLIDDQSGFSSLKSVDFRGIFTIFIGVLVLVAAPKASAQQLFRLSHSLLR